MLRTELSLALSIQANCLSERAYGALPALFCELSLENGIDRAVRQEVQGHGLACERGILQQGITDLGVGILGKAVRMPRGRQASLEDRREGLEQCPVRETRKVCEAKILLVDHAGRRKQLPCRARLRAGRPTAGTRYSHVRPAFENKAHRKATPKRMAAMPYILKRRSAA